MDYIKTVQLGLAMAFVLVALLLVFAYWFPSMRGPTWTDKELLAAIVFALLAIAVRP